MAAPTGIAGALAVPVAPPPTSTEATAAAAAPPAKTMEQLMKEIDDVKKAVEVSVKKWKDLDVGKKKIEANRSQAVQGRQEIHGLKERINNLQRQVDAATQAGDPTPKTFDKRKKNAQKSIATLLSKLNDADKHLEKAAGSVPVIATPATGVPPTTTPVTNQPVAAPTATTEPENTKGIRSLFGRLPLAKKKSASKESLNATAQPATATVPAKPADAAAHKPAKDAGASGDEEVDDDDEGEYEGSDDDDVISDSKREPGKPPRSPRKVDATKVESDVSDSSEDDDEDDDDGADDNRQLLDELQKKTLTDESPKGPPSDGRRSRTPTTPRSSKHVPPIKIDSTGASSPKTKKTSTLVAPTPAIRKKTPSPRRRTHAPPPKKEEEEESDDSFFEEEGEGEEEDDEDEELRRLGDTGEREEHESDHDYVEGEDEETAAIVNAHTQELRTSKYPPGTQFVVTHDLTGVQTGDLTIHKGETLTLIEQRPDDWWLFKHNQIQQQGVVPINHIQLLSGQQPRRRAKPSTSATTLVDAFKTNNNIPDGFIASDLAPLTELDDYKLSRAMVPKMTDSNLAFADLHWRVDNDQLHVHDVTYQKILTLKECVRIPRARGEQIRVLDRCVRVCLYDGYQIVSNIQTIRAHIPKKIDERDLTENWTFVPNDINTLIDEQSQLLIRSNRSDPCQHLNLLIELSQWCQSTVTQEKCEIACGWSIIPLEDDKPPLISDTKSYDELLHGGHTAETNVLLDSQYKVLRSDGLSGRIDRYKRARVKFSIESRETDVDLLYDTLPIQPIVVPINLIKTLSFFRSELAFLLHKRQHPTGLSTTPIDSVFLSTFFRALPQSDLIYTLRRLYRTRRKRVLPSSASLQQQREEFIKTYETFIYPLLHYRQLPPYDFHDIAALNERRKLINEMVKRQFPGRKTVAQDLLSVLLDPNLTDKWTPFTTDEISFTLQKYINNSTSDVVA